MIRLGRICYVNMAPVYYRLEAEVEEVAGVPTELARKLLGGEVDVAAIPSIEFARNAEALEMMPRLCVASDGAVDSIQLVSSVAPERLRRIAVTPESATSVALIRILFPRAEQVPLGEPAQAKLLIGDAALRSAFEDPTPHYDLGRVWRERTGLPMVFAVWAYRKGADAGMAELEQALLSSVRAARSEPERLAQQASERYGYPPGFLARYFEKLRYGFGPREREGLLRFYELGSSVGALGRVPELAASGVSE
ncbi:MAG: menaquinone biosynthesis protein [Gaiellaceae bacterium]|jgi:chorismate dehydratase